MEKLAEESPDEAETAGLVISGEEDSDEEKSDEEKSDEEKSEYERPYDDSP
ncbi:hypothetical protein AB0K60_31900 [Thermopolyspora sp. NPDC052614]|uniref:hypothetical protein n=1 Tax=Thermopolyspora sp. NPDC052614 TaxID=3155682 RepID=UPI003443709F